MMYQSIIYIIYNLNLKEINLLSMYVITEIEHYFLSTSNACTKSIAIVTVYSYPNYTDD